MRRLPLTLPPDLYKRLEAAAKADDRDALQQARVLLRRALEADTRPQQDAPK